MTQAELVSQHAVCNGFLLNQAVSLPNLLVCYNASMTHYEFLLLGSFQLHSDNVETETSLERKTRAILAFLAATGAAHSRRFLWGMFCQNAKDPAGSLRWHLSRIRRGLDADILVATPQSVTLNTAVFHTDLTSFQQTLDAPHQHPTDTLAQAVALYRGPFLDDLALRDAPEFDLWLLGERARCQLLYEKGASALVNRHIQQKQYPQAIQTAQKLLQTNPFLEAIHARLVWLYAQSGQRDVARQQYQRCRDLLQQELAVEPSAEMEALITAVSQQPQAAHFLPPITTEPEPPPQLTIQPPTQTDFVGRKAELKQLQDAWQNSPQQGAIILIEGVAGAGKTRLTQHFFHTLLPDTPSLIGNCYESTRAISYHPWLTILEAQWQQLTIPEKARLAQPWQAQLSRLLPHIFIKTGDAPEQQEHLFRAAAELLLCINNTPRILLLEDLQWADETSLQLFLFMIQFIRTAQSPVLLLGTFRTEEVADNPALQTLLRDTQREELARRLSLPPLGKEEIGSLINLLWLNLPETMPMDEIRDSLLVTAGGNPLFITEIVRELTQTAVLPTALPVPPSLQELTNHRLQQLPGSSRQIIEALAILEQPTHFDLMQQISGRSEDETINAIELGLRWRFLESNPKGQYRFSHDLIGSAVRSQLSQIRRQRLHHRTANILTQHGADAAILAHHWRQAGDQKQQIHFALLAGQQAFNRAAFGDAIQLFQNVLDTLPPAETQQRFQATLGIVRSLEATSNTAALAEKLLTLADLAEKTDDLACRAEAAQHQARFTLTQGELEKVQTVAQQGLAWAVTAQAIDVQAKLLETIGKMYREKGDYDQAHSYAEQALQLYQDGDSRQGQITVLSLMGDLYMHQGQHRHAVEVHRQAVALCRQLADPFSESRILASLANTLWHLGDYGEVRAVVEEGLAVSRAIGDKVGEAAQLNNLAGLATSRQDSKTAIDYYRQALAIAESINDSRQITAYYNNIGGAYVGLGDINTALPYLEKAITIAREADLPRQEAYACHTLGYAYQQANDHVLARTAFEQALSLRQELGEQFRTFFTHIYLLETCLILKDTEAAESHLLAAQYLYEPLHDEIPQYAHQLYHYNAFLFYKTQANALFAAKHIELAHHAMQNRLSEMDGEEREQFLNSAPSQAILTALSNLN